MCLRKSKEVAVLGGCGQRGNRGQFLQGLVGHSDDLALTLR